jgi:hypothetical protein
LFLGPGNSGGSVGFDRTLCDLLVAYVFLKPPKLP